MRVRNASKSTVHIRRRRIEPGETAELSEEELRMSGVQALLKDGTLVEVEDAVKKPAEKTAEGAMEETAEGKPARRRRRAAREKERSK